MCSKHILIVAFLAVLVTAASGLIREEIEERALVYLGMCTGSVISEWHILTLARCIRLTKFVLVGSTNAVKGQKFEVDKFVIHPKFDKEADDSEYDVGVLKVKQPFVFGEKMQPIRLAKADYPEIPNGTALWAKGWTSSRYLERLSAPKVPLMDCDWLLPDLTETMICAGNEGDEGKCGEISGAPLFTQDNIQVGLTMDYSNCRGPRPFISVSFVSDWIKEQIAKM